MTSTFEVTTKLDLITVECYACSVVFAMPKSLQRRCREEQGRTFYCPNGHPQIYTKSDNTKLREQIERLERQASAKAEQARIAEESRWKTEAQMKQLKNRTSKGVCPCCNRSFMALQRHIKTKHPDFAEFRLTGRDSLCPDGAAFVSTMPSSPSGNSKRASCEK